jgi:hypothetical protein
MVAQNRPGWLMGCLGHRLRVLTGQVGCTNSALIGVLNLSASEAKARAGHAELLAPRRSLTGEELPPLLPSTAAELAAGTIGPTHVRVITAVKRRSYTMM